MSRQRLMPPDFPSSPPDFARLIFTRPDAACPPAAEFRCLITKCQWFAVAPEP